MTPSKEAKAYAAKHGYTLLVNSSIGRIDVSHGDRIVGSRAKYPEVLTLMKRDASLQAQARKVERNADFGKLGPLSLALDPNRIRDMARSMRNANPWHVYVNGRHVAQCANRADAVTALRRDYNASLRDGARIKGARKDDWKARIIYAGV